MENLFAGILRGVNSAKETYFIHLETAEKVLLYPPTAGKKIRLVPDEITERDIKYVARMQQEGRISIDALNKLKETFEFQSKKEKVTDKYEEIEKYHEKQVSYVELIYAIHNRYVPEAEIIEYSFYHGDELEEHMVKYTK